MTEIAITLKTVHLYTRHLDIKKGDLPDALCEVFDEAAYNARTGKRLVPVSLLVSQKDHASAAGGAKTNKTDSRETAFRRMAAALRGDCPRRGPLEVRLRTDGNYLVVDGNATAQVLMLTGWQLAPVVVSKEPEECGAT